MLVWVSRVPSIEQFDKPFSTEKKFEPTVSQSTVSSAPPKSDAPASTCSSRQTTHETLHEKKILLILYYTILYYTVLYCTILYYTILYYIIQYNTILYYTTRHDTTLLYHNILKDR